MRFLPPLFLICLLPLSVQAGDRTIIVKKKSQIVQGILQKLDTTDPKTFQCNTVQSDLQELICRGGLIASNKQLASDRTELAIVMGRHQLLADKANRAWLLSRNADCEIEASNFTGNMAATAYVGCFISANRKRHDYLQTQIDRLKK